MKNIFTIIFISLLSLNGQTAEQIKKQLKDTGVTPDQAKQMAKDRSMVDKQVEAEGQVRGIEIETATSDESAIKTSDIDLDNQVAEKTPSQTTLEVIEIDGVKYIKDGLRYIPVLSEGYEAMEEQKELETVTDEQEETLDDELEIIEEELVLGKIGDPRREATSYYGYQIFEGDPAAFQASTFGAIDPNYNIGPGDQIIVMLWGEFQDRQEFIVDREGYVFVPEVGQVFVNGLNLESLEKKFFLILSKVYSTIKPATGKATTFMDISLGNLRPLRIIVLGEVGQPGAYSVSPSTSLSSSLYYFRGPTTLGSLRDIRLLRKNKLIGSTDFYDYLLSGKAPDDPRLQLDDIVFIPPRGKTVAIRGEINRPAIYELRDKEGLKDLIEIAGGLRITTYMDRVQIERIVAPENRAELGMDRMLVDVNLSDILSRKQDYPLQDGDRVNLFSILEHRENIVYISGAVVRPGTYEYGAGLTLRDLILQADSLLGESYLERADVVRINSDLTETLLKLNLGKVMAGHSDQNIMLKPMDRVQVYSLMEMVSRSYVSISGHVKESGHYLLRKNMNLYDLIFKAGGFIDEAWLKLAYTPRAELVRVREDSVTKKIIPFRLDEVLNNKGMADMMLRPDDAVRIYSLEEIKGTGKFVSISGHVKLPGKYGLYEDNMSLYDLLFKAGGFDDVEYKSTVFLERADLIRVDEDRITSSIIPFNLGEVLVNENSPQNFKLNSGDEVRIYSLEVFNAEKSVTIDGVRNPGSFFLKTGMTIKDLILESGGVSEDVYRYKIEVARIDPLNTNRNIYAEILTLDMASDFSLSNIQYQSSSNPGVLSVKRSEFKLQPYDRISIRPDPNFSLQRTVIVSGQVNYPGTYTLIRPNEKVSDIIRRAGGLRQEAYPIASSLIRNGQKIRLSFEKIIKNSESRENFKLLDGDQITINAHPNIVFMNGEVHTPGNYKFYPGMRLRGYISIAGGLTTDAEKRDIWVNYPDGTSRQLKRFFPAPRISDGAIISVGREEETEPLDRTEFAKEVASIIADFVQIALTLVLLSNTSGG